MELIFNIKSGPIMLRSSEMCYEICRQRSRIDKESGTSSDSWEPYLFLANISSALNRIIDIKIKASDARSLAELKAVIESARNEVCRVWDASSKVTW